jgi:predicted transcriptional regulator
MKMSDLVATARRLARLTQRELAQRAGVPQSTIARIESGAIEPRSSTVQRIVSSAGYELRLEPLVTGDVDRSLIRRFLRLSPAQRIEYAASGGRLAARMRKGLRKA